MSEANSKNKDDANNLNTKWFVIALCLIALVILGFYFGNFHGGLSLDNGVWGTFGDYVGGILNPLIAAFAFYLIAETYKLQKTELKATRELLEVSTDVQKNQIKIAAITALLNSNLTKINMLDSEKIILKPKVEPRGLLYDNRGPEKPENIRFNEIEKEIVRLAKENIGFQEQLEKFLN